MIALVLLGLVSGGLLLVALPPACYLGSLGLLSWQGRRRGASNQSQRFVVVVPAHNERANIASTVASLQACDYPKERAAIWVVADNCSDDTAAVARAAGAHVLERSHATERGKGYALNFAFAQVLAAGQTDAVVVVDADTVVSGNLLSAFASRLVDGALAMQAEYGVRNPQASWRTRLMAVALGMFHRVRGIARERLGLSAGLRGNGMCFAVACLQRFPHDAHGLVEDVEYGIALGHGGVRVAYVDEAQVLGEMVSGGKDSESQRARWEDGRRLLWRQTLPGLVKAAVRSRSLLLLDLAIDLAIPPLGRLAAWLVLGTCAELARLEAMGWLAATVQQISDGAPLAGAMGPHLADNVGTLTYAWALAWAMLAVYIGRGMALSHLGMGAVWAMLGAPLYLAWKVLLAAKRRWAPPKSAAAGEWVRTAREAPAGSPATGGQSPGAPEGASPGPKQHDDRPPDGHAAKPPHSR